MSVLAQPPRDRTRVPTNVKLLSGLRVINGGWSGGYDPFAYYLTGTLHRSTLPLIIEGERWWSSVLLVSVWSIIRVGEG